MSKLLVLAGLALLTVAGCGGDGKMKARGKVLKGGKPLTIPNDDYMRIQFAPDNGPGTPPKTSYLANYDNATGTFVVVGADLKGLPAGKYRVCVAQERGKKDVFRGAYDLPNNAIPVDVADAGTEIVLDLDAAKK